MPDKILIVDDEPEMVDAARMVLKGEGYLVVGSSNGEEALQKADSEGPDLVFLDVVMPGKSGLEVCRILKSQPKTRHIPVVMFTALGRQVDRKLGTEAGADGYFTKPFPPEALLSEVKKHIDQSRAEKFSRQLGIEHDKLHGKKILLEFDPSAPYERLVRDFALECAAHKEVVIVLTTKGSAIRQALEGERSVELGDMMPELMFSSLLERHRDSPLNLVYDNLTILALSSNSQTAYKFAQNAIQLLSDPRITAVFLLNSSAHEARDVYSLKGLFSTQATYGKQGMDNVRIT